MKNGDDSKSKQPLPPLRFVIFEGDEEINAAQFPKEPNACEPVRHRNLIGDLLIIDGPEEMQG